MTSSDQVAPATALSPCLARQPILTGGENVFGYELLYRESPEETRFNSDSETATSSIVNTLSVMGIDLVCDGGFAFINSTHAMLINECFLQLPPDKVVIEVQENTPADETVIAACTRLRLKGYKIALDNFMPDSSREALVQHSDFLKLDVRTVPQGNGRAMIERYSDPQRRLLAQKVETREQFTNGVRDGFKLFQGYFFRRPERMRARNISATQSSYLRLLQAITKPELDLKEIEDLIKHDTSICYRLLRYMNSPMLGASSPVKSVRHGGARVGQLGSRGRASEKTQPFTDLRKSRL